MRTDSPGLEVGQPSGQASLTLPASEGLISGGWVWDFGAQ